MPFLSVKMNAQDLNFVQVGLGSSTAFIEVTVNYHRSDTLCSIKVSYRVIKKVITKHWILEVMRSNSISRQNNNTEKEERKPNLNVLSQ